ncbi:MAG: OprO/OprP family phosphate-selective porin [Bacteroidales bacterium]
MKKVLSSLLLLFVASFSFGQNAKEQAEALVKNGSIRFQSENGDVKLRMGTRFSFDGAYYFDDVSDLKSGTKIGEARIRLYGTFYKNFDAKFDLDFKGGKVAFKDIYTRYHLNNNSFLKIGHYTEPFSAQALTSTGDIRFIGRPMSVQAFAPGRHLGISYRYYGNLLWFEGGLFGDDVYGNTKGDDGYAITSRLVLRPVLSDGFNLHIGGSATYRTAGALGFEGGDDDYNRAIEYQAKSESTVDGTHFLDTKIKHAKDQFKYNAELLVTFRNFSFMGEYTGAQVSREYDYQKAFEEQLGGQYSWVKIDNFKKWMGNYRNLNFSGFYAQLGWLITGGDYKYDAVNGLIAKPAPGSLELVGRYNYTNLDDVDGLYFNGKFYDDIGLGKPNNSVSGGVAKSAGLAVNYYWKPNIRFMLDYNYMNLTSHKYLDKNISMVQARMQIGF